MRVITIYKPEGIYDDPFHNEFCDLLTDFFSKPGSYKPLILGDFNLHVNDVSDNYANKFKSTLSNFGLDQHVAFPTYEKGNTLDLVITRHDLGIFDIRADASVTSDHLAILFSLSSPRPQPPKKSVQFRKWKNVDIQRF